MSNTSCQTFNWLLIPLAAIVTGVLTIPLGIIELYMLWAFTIFVTAAHIHYGICVVGVSTYTIDIARLFCRCLNMHICIVGISTCDMASVL